MKLLSIIFILFLSFGVFGQETKCENGTCITSQGFIDDATKAFKLVVEQRKAVLDLETTVAAKNAEIVALQKAQLTPCAVQNQVTKTDLDFWIRKLESAKDNPVLQKQLVKIIKSRISINSKAEAKQCGFQDSKRWYEYVWAVAPFALLFL